MKRWRKVNNVPASSKIFICSNGYPSLVEALLERGWVRNKAFDSPVFDLMWTLKRSEINYNWLDKTDVVNHFAKNSCITSKRGLTVSVRNLIWHNNIDIDTFFPRSFYLNNVEDLEDFQEEFKAVKVTPWMTLL